MSTSYTSQTSLGFEFQPCGQECFNVKSVLIIRVGSVLEIGVLGDVVLIRKERTHTAQLEDTLAAIHNSKLILAHQLFATMSSDEFKKDKHYPKKTFFYGICLFCFR